MRCNRPSLDKELLGTFSKGIYSIPFLSELLDAPVASCRWRQSPEALHAILGWGHKPNTRKARRYARRLGKPYWRLEDGFLRSYAPGTHFPPLSLIVDKSGIYYDSTCSSDLEYLLQYASEVLVNDESERAREQMTTYKLSKYNHAPFLCPEMLRAGDDQRVLVVDQTQGDLSVVLGNACAQTFVHMLSTALQENPRATIYVKMHPETSLGAKRGYLERDVDSSRIVMLREPVNPLSLVAEMDKVYVVTSQLGFEALLLNKPVTVFGLPWYAGWGITEDRQQCFRRTRSRTLAELFAAAFLHYPVYLNPYTHTRGTVFDVIEWLLQQRETLVYLHNKTPNYVFTKRMSVWKRTNIEAFLGLHQMKLASAKRFKMTSTHSESVAVYWGEGASRTNFPCHISLEDGFIRSVGLGAKRVRPCSLVVDKQGIYFDPRRLSCLESILNSKRFDAPLLARAKQVRHFIVQHHVTKYNVAPLSTVDWPSCGRFIILVPGQVEDDASIRLGSIEISSNLALVQAVRAAQPDAYIVYKPHPDVTHGLRYGGSNRLIASYVDYVEQHASIISCINQADAIHTMTSLSGFDALLRGKPVVTYGEPFYAGWGLTEDKIRYRQSFHRRTRQLSIDELVAGVLLCYPLYYDWSLNGYTSCEAVLWQIAAQFRANNS